MPWFPDFVDAVELVRRQKRPKAGRIRSRTRILDRAGDATH
jgi:hypothetical protein